MEDYYEADVNGGFHFELMQCRGRCPVNSGKNDQFFDQLRQETTLLANKLSQRLDQADFQIEIGPNFQDRQLVRLFEIPINSYYDDAVWVGPLKENTSDELNRIVAEIVNVLYYCDDSYLPTAGFSAKTTLSLYFYLYGKDANKFELILTTANLPVCLKGHLLLTALKMHFLDAIDALLRNGARPDSYVFEEEDKTHVPADHPLMACSNEFKPEKHLQLAQVQNLTEIFKLLVKHSNKVRLSDGGKDCIIREILRYRLNEIALTRAFLVVGILLEEAIRGGPIRKSYELASDALTPFVTKICVLTSSHTVIDISHWINHAVLPTLRAGVRFRFADLVETVYQLCLSKKLDDLNSFGGTAAVSLQLYGQPYALFDLLLEASIQPERELFRTPSIGENVYPQSNHWIDFIVNQAMPRFYDRLLKCRCLPLRLQTLSRRAILRRLPLGISARNKAIEKLKLPREINALLQFYDYVPLFV